MDETQRTHLYTYRSDLDRLVHRGRELRDRLAAHSSGASAFDGAQARAFDEAQARAFDEAQARQETRAWQQDCAALVNRLSGGSKAHWLARAYSQAFLVRSPAREVVEEAKPAEIVERILEVLDQAGASLSRLGDVEPETAPQARRFEFVHNTELRPILEQAYLESRRALEEGRFGLAFITSCGILEAVITDALEQSVPNGHDVPTGRIVDWPFEARIAAAEGTKLIRGGCARLPPLALKYRDLADASGAVRPEVTIAERDARLAGQVLRIVMRDLDPGR